MRGRIGVISPMISIATEIVRTTRPTGGESPTELPTSRVAVSACKGVRSFRIVLSVAPTRCDGTTDLSWFSAHADGD